VLRGYELNYKLTARPSQRHGGSLPVEHSFVRTEADNVVLTALKKSEDDDSMVLRFYEWAGREADVTLHLPAGAQSASETDLMERATADLAVNHLGANHDAVTVHTKPYEIKTVKVRFAPHAPPNAVP
jgi:alpha-mannosidase